LYLFLGAIQRFFLSFFREKVVTIQRTASALNCNAHGLRFATVGAKPTSTGRRAPPCRIGFADAKYALWHILNAVYVRTAHMASIGVPASQVYWAAGLRFATVVAKQTATGCLATRGKRVARR
jgi:hypothetical protein